MCYPCISKGQRENFCSSRVHINRSKCPVELFPNQRFEQPEIQVSHQIKGRIPDSTHKNVKELLDHDKTKYFEKMAFIVIVSSVLATSNGNELALRLGGVRSYNLEKLYNKKSFEKLKFFILFQNKVCCILCVWIDDFTEEIKIAS
ncbi:hypothetical protein FFWV33_02090 [Flavobacterium faecale]|uniref:Uncharacterized protein n=1 Tax=Flavobacterium faecale TaxID=1355330 RepID=A0A2S1L9K8_9FLAO|nr:hypothetical protein FFWV33_02090 [Flavobacterium faecale]